MKKFLINIVIFFAVIAVCDYALGSALLYMNLNAKVADNGRNNAINKEMTADIVIMGSSRALHHYVPQIIEDSLGMTCYNAGTDGQGIVLNYAHYLLFSKRYTPKILIYDIQPDYDLNANDNTRYLKWLKPYFYDPEIKKIFKEISTTEDLKMLSHLYRVNNNVLESIHDYFYPNIGEDVNNGYTAVKGVLDYEPVYEEPRFECDSLKLDYFEKLVVDCRKNGTQVIFCASPFYGKTYIAPYKTAMAIAEKYNIPFYNYLDEPKFETDGTLFNDPGHLNEDGAIMYTSQISKEICRQYR